MNLFLSPHNDDETLFGAFLIQRAPCRVVVCLRSFVEAERWPHAHYRVREAETAAALAELGVSDWTQWAFDDRNPYWPGVLEMMESLVDEFDAVYAPAVEVGGHDHHNTIGELAAEAFGVDRVQGYSTYTRHGGRSAIGAKVVPEPDWIVRKLRALARYESQIEIDAMRPHFVRGLDEYLIP